MNRAGTLSGAGYIDDMVALRPIICLKSEVQLIEQEDGKYVIQ